MPTIGTRPWYKDWFDSPFYHKLYFEHDEEEARKFIQNLIAFIQPPPGARILDAACGRGRHAMILAEMGFETTGIDLSSESIRIAKQQSLPNLEFYQHDMRLLFRTNYYDCLLNLFTSFGYFATRREHDDAMRTFAAALKPGGILVIDFLNVHYAEDHLVHHEVKQISGTNFDINRWDDALHFYKKILVTDVALTTPQEYTEQVAKFSLGDFNDMLAFRNLQVVEVFGDYHLIPYDVGKTPRMIIIAKKNSGDGRSTEREKRLYSDGRRSDALT